MSRFDVGEPDLWDEVDEAIDRIQEPVEVVLTPIRKWVDEHRVSNGGFDCVQARDVHQIIERAEAFLNKGTADD